MPGWVRWSTMVILVLAIGSASRAEDSTVAASTPAAELAAVDAFFLTAYGRAAQKVLPDEPPAFLVLPKRLVLYRGGARQTRANDV